MFGYLRYLMSQRDLRIPITLPPTEAQRHTCSACITERLSRREGVRRVALTRSDKMPGQAFLEMRYDADLLSLDQINAYLKTAGSCFSPSMRQMVLPAQWVGSRSDERAVEHALEQLPSVRCVASSHSQTVRLEFDQTRITLDRIIEELNSLSVGSSDDGCDDDGNERRAASGPMPARPHWLRTAVRQTDVVMAALAGVFLLAGFLVHMMDGPQPLRLALILVSYVCGGFFPVQETVRTLMRFRLDIDVLMFAAAFGAAALGHFEEGAMLLFLFSLGGAGENLAMNRARSAIQALTRLAPRTALRVLDGGQREEIPVEQLRVGDTVFIASGQQVPADGNVVTGASTIDQSSITGESIPVEKVAGDEVFAGTLNGNGSLEVRVLKLASETTLSKLIRMVEEAQSTKSPTQAFTDKVEKWYVPAVVLATVGVAVVPPLLGIEPTRTHSNDWAGWFYQAMAFLTAASPCALAIGTPAAVLSGIARAAQVGVLIKGGVHLENLGQVKAIAFDKTGTLTIGEPQVTDVVALDRNMNEDQLLLIAAAVENGSRHPLAQAIVRAAEKRGMKLPTATDVSQTPGVGIRGRVEGRLVDVGRSAAMTVVQAEQLEAGGKTVVGISEDDRLLGLIALADEPRPDVERMIRQIHAMGIRQTIMLTGDNERTAKAIAAHVGIDHVQANLMPEQKLETIRMLDKQYRRVAMVGDGVNDAPALANATVGIAIGGAGSGSDVAMESADIVILGKDVHRMADAIGISRFSRKIILQNLILALGVIVTVAPIAALGGAAISAAVLLHEGSTVLVVLNALRILRYKPKQV
jgi:Cd2+/Zn2+-exporting ATPase